MRVEGTTSRKLTLLGDIPFIYFSFSFHFFVVVAVKKNLKKCFLFVLFPDFFFVMDGEMSIQPVILLFLEAGSCHRNEVFRKHSSMV